MPDLFSSTETPHYWYSLVSAAPTPENGERANVAILVGNGRAYQLRFEPKLPRLAGIAAIDEILVYESVLQSLATDVARGMDAVSVAVALAPQLVVQPPRALFDAPSDAMVERLAARYLKKPVDPPHQINLQALIRKSNAQLDSVLDQAVRPGVAVARNITPKVLYGSEFKQRAAYPVPRLARAVRGAHRDLLVDSLTFGEADAQNLVRMAAGRISQAFYAYDQRLRTMIQAYRGTEIRLVGVLPAAERDESDNVRAVREWVIDSWKHNAAVIDGDREDVTESLRDHAEWAAAG